MPGLLRFDMPAEKSRQPHGAFAFLFEDDYTLITFSGLWNIECTDIYDALLRRRIRSRPDLRRCAIIDARNWDLETPDSGRKKKELNLRLSNYYKELYIAYVLSPENIHLGKYIIDMNNSEFSEVMKWQMFSDIQSAVAWLRDRNFNIPDTGELAFPEAVPAWEYLKFLN